ncbi:MAG: hypothetical protein ABI947_25455 [Chloroflexota bacterium]
MSRSRIVFVLIIVAALAVVGASQLVNRLPVTPTPTPRPPLQIEVAVTPLAYDWVSEQAALFNQQRTQVEGQVIEVRVTSRDGIDIWQTGGVWSSANHPVAWIPEAAFVLDYASEAGVRYEVLTPSLASTSLIWGIFSDRANAIGKTTDWDTIQPASVKGSWKDLGGQESWGFIKAAFPLPQRSTVGYGVLLSAAASYAKNGQLSPQNVSNRDFQTWLQPVITAVPNFASLGQQPITVLASRGVSVADFALLPESDWLVYYDRINSRQPIHFAYPAYKLTFDMPFAVWSGAETTSAERISAKQFADFLGQQAAQKRSAAFGLRPSKLDLNSADVSLFSAATSAGIVLDTPPGTPINVPSRSSALGVLSWFRSIQSS